MAYVVYYSVLLLLMMRVWLDKGYGFAGFPYRQTGKPFTHENKSGLGSL